MCILGTRLTHRHKHTHCPDSNLDRNGYAHSNNNVYPLAFSDSYGDSNTLSIADTQRNIHP
jgi:hypothetical protein